MSTGPAPTRTARAAAAVLGALALAGCGLLGHDDAPAPTAAAPTTAATTTTTEVPGPTVLDAGGAPRRELRLQLRAGTTQTVSVISEIDVDQRSDGRRQRVDGPPIAQVLTYRVTGVDGGQAALSFSLDDVRVDRAGTGLDDDAVAALEAELAPLVGLTGTGTLSDRGRFRDVAFDLPGDLAPDLAARIGALTDQLAALGPALPDEAVGTGARWRTRTTTDVAGSPFTTTTTYTLDDLGTDRINYSAELVLDAPAGPLEVAGLAEGTTARLASARLTGTAAGSQPLDAPIPLSETRITGDQAVDLEAGGRTTRLTQQLDLVVRTGPTAS